MRKKVFKSIYLFYFSSNTHKHSGIGYFRLISHCFHLKLLDVFLSIHQLNFVPNRINITLTCRTHPYILIIFYKDNRDIKKPIQQMKAY